MPVALVVDDDRWIVKTTAQVLEREGYSVLTAHDVPRAVILLCESPPDLMVLDLHMPIVEGVELLAALRKSTWGRKIPVVAMSGIYGRHHSAVQDAEGLGAVFLSKPCSIHDLREASKMAQSIIANGFVPRDPESMVVTLSLSPAH